MPLDVIIVQHAEKEPAPDDPGLTPRGRDHALRVGALLRNAGTIDELWCSPLQRAHETAAHIASVLDFPTSAIRRDDRIRERINWPGEPHQSREAFQREWERSTADREFRTSFGDSSHVAGGRFAAFLEECYTARPDGRMIVVAHGGVTIDLVRTWFGDAHVRGLAIGAIEHGIDPCGITRITLDGGAKSLLSIGADITRVAL